jgi:hypothetical protein
MPSPPDIGSGVPARNGKCRSKSKYHWRPAEVPSRLRPSVCLQCVNAQNFIATCTTGLTRRSPRPPKEEIERDSGYAIEFMDDLRSRLANRVQLTTDGHKAYLEAVEGAFGGDVDFAQLGLYGASPESVKGRYRSAGMHWHQKTPIEGNPDPTSFGEPWSSGVMSPDRICASSPVR